MNRSASAIRLRRLAAAALLALAAARPASAQIAAPGDVYYEVHVDQIFKYYAFAQDQVVWEDADFAGTSLAASAVHDTSDVAGTVHVGADFAADAGTFTLDASSSIDALVRTGIYHRMTNTVAVTVYVKGPTGTPYWITTSTEGGIDVWRLGGAPGWAQPVNGTSWAVLADTSATVNYDGAISLPVDDSGLFQGNTGTQILVDGVTYSRAGTYVFAHTAEVTQAVCILGCMTAPADFRALTSGRSEVHVYPFAAPTDVPVVAAPVAPRVSASPNPLRAATTVSFQAPAGRRAAVRVHDVTGRLVADLFDGPSTGGEQRVAWAPRGLAAGIYFVRVDAGDASASGKLTLMK